MIDNSVPKKYLATCTKCWRYFYYIDRPLEERTGIICPWPDCKYDPSKPTIEANK